MNTVVEKLPNCLATLRVEISAEEVGKERAVIVDKLTKNARVPGFRPGKAPLAVLEKKFEKDINRDLMEVLIRAAINQALEQEQLKVLEFGVIEDFVFNDEGSSFHCTLTLAPAFTLPEYKGIAVSAPPLALPEGAVEAHLQQLSERFGDFHDITDRAAELGDYAVIDYTTTVDGQPTDEFLGRPAGVLSGKEGFWVRLDEGYFLPGFAVQVAGMRAGDSRDISIVLPEDYAITELAGKTLVLATTLKELKLSVPAVLDDAFANRLSPGATMEEITRNVTGNLAAEREQKISDHKVNQIISYLNSKVDCELPESLVREETQTQADEMVERGLKAGLSEDEIKERQDEIFNAASYRAVSSIRTNFILREIAAVEGLTIEDKELATHLVQLAVSRKLDPKKFIADLKKQGRIESIRRSMLVGKTIDFLLEHATVSEDAAEALPE